MFPRILCIITTLHDDPTLTIKSLLAQSIQVTKIIVAAGSEKKVLLKSNENSITQIFIRPDFNKSLGERLGAAINASLESVNITDYDYILKMDADVILPILFLEINLTADADLNGRFGFCMLLKVNTFLKVLGGKWPELTTEDTYIEHFYSSLGFSVIDPALPPLVKRNAGVHYSWHSQLDRGVSWYKMGYEPLHVFISSFVGFRTNPRTIYSLIGYTYACLLRFEKYTFAGWLFKQQLKQFYDLSQLGKRVRMNILPYA
jgi:hypothetical protein